MAPPACQNRPLSPQHYQFHIADIIPKLTKPPRPIIRGRRRNPAEASRGSGRVLQFLAPALVSAPPGVCQHLEVFHPKLRPALVIYRRPILDTSSGRAPLLPAGYRFGHLSHFALVFLIISIFHLPPAQIAVARGFPRLLAEEIIPKSLLSVSNVWHFPPSFPNTTSTSICIPRKPDAE